ncbi:MAG: aminotransferase class V-fold PLP-dependent enzyme [Candidatus Thorarchaeota archaeon]
MTPELNIRPDFSIFETEPELVYLDSASTSLVPRVAVDATSEFLRNTVSSTRRGAHHLAVHASTMVEDVRNSLASFFDTDKSQISFQKSIPTTVASLTYGLDWKGTKRNKIVIAQSEEHSVMVALLRVAELLNLEVQLVPVDDEGNLDMESLERAVDETTGIVAVNHVAVGIGTRNPIPQIAKVSHENGALLLTDATQSAGVSEVNPSALSADVILFSANIGLMAPPGLVIQWIDKSIGENHRPGILGGSAVADVMHGSFELAFQPDKFESGMLNVPAIAGLGASLEYLRQLQARGLARYMNEISSYMIGRLSEMQTLTLYGNRNENNTIVGFNVGAENGMNCHEVALFLDDSNIAVRSGLVCAHPLIKPMSEEGIIQASLHAYNSISDIDRFVDSLQTIVRELL